MNTKSILIFGAGRIGRSFIGQLFGMAGYEVVFSDVDTRLVNLLNEKRSYSVVIKSEEEETITISNIRAVHAKERSAVIKEVKNCSIAAVCVGKKALEQIIPVIAEGLLERYAASPDSSLNIIIAENMRSAAAFMHDELSRQLPPRYPLDRLVGLIETSIGKMVPIMTAKELEQDPLAISAEPYNDLIVDGEAFVGGIPPVEGLHPKKNIKAWVDRKAFIHNLGHAATAYHGHFKHPEAIYIHEVLEDPGVYNFARSVMVQSASILLSLYADDFTMDDLLAHVDDLLDRFRNRHLKDTLFRVGQDLPRKLGPDDRFMGIIRIAEREKKEFILILEAMTHAFYFKAVDENQQRSPQDLLFDQYMAKGVDYILEKVCGFDHGKDEHLAQEIKRIITENELDTRYKKSILEK